jgi:hypothetical protein
VCQVLFFRKKKKNFTIFTAKWAFFVTIYNERLHFALSVPVRIIATTIDSELKNRSPTKTISEKKQ